MQQDGAHSDFDFCQLENQVQELKNQRANVAQRMGRAPKSKHLEAKFDLLTEKITQLEEQIVRWQRQEEVLAHSYYNDEEGDIDGVFGAGLLGNTIKNIAIAAAVPVTLAWRFAERHPLFAAGLVLGTQIVGVGATPVQTSSQTKAGLVDARRERIIKNNFKRAMSECANEEKLTVMCGEKLIESWRENKGNLERQIALEKLLASQHVQDRAKDGYAEVFINRAAKWHECTTGASQSVVEKCHAQVKKYSELAIDDVSIYLDSSQGIKEVMLDKNLKGNESYPSLERRLEFAKMATYPYTQNASILSDGWSLNRNLTQELALETGLNFDITTGQIYSSAGMVAYVFEKTTVNDEVKEICLSFGGTTTGPVASHGLIERFKGNSGATGAQLVANAASVLSLQSPALHDQAIRLAGELEKLIDEKFENAKMVVTGHSLGGGLCTVAAGMTGTADEPTECYGFASGPINGALKAKIARRAGNKQHAKIIMKNIHHTTVKGDPVPHAHNHIVSASIAGEILEINAENIQGARHAIFKEAIEQRIVLTRDARAKRDTGDQSGPEFTRPVELVIEPDQTSQKHQHSPRHHLQHKHHHHQEEESSSQQAQQDVNDMLEDAIYSDDIPHDEL